MINNFDKSGKALVKASMLSDILMLEIIAHKKLDYAHERTWPDVSLWPGGGSWTLFCDFSSRLPGVPYKVLLAKMKKLEKRELVTGCTCGCRGDFELTDKGRYFLIHGKMPDVTTS